VIRPGILDRDYGREEALPFDGKQFPGQSGTAGRVAAFWLRAGAFAGRLLPRARNLPLELRSPGYPGNPEDARVRLLTLGRELIAVEGNWVRHCYETIGGRRCAVGALRAAARFTGLRLGEAQAILLAVAWERGFADVETMNDKATHGQVLSAFDDAIARARAMAA
jgi:hypothetical protein